MADLDEIFGSTHTPEESPDNQVEPSGEPTAAETAAEPARDAQGRFTGQVEPVTTATVQTVEPGAQAAAEPGDSPAAGAETVVDDEPTRKVRAFQSVAEDERRKRQTVEAERDQLRAFVAQMQQRPPVQQPQPAVPPVDPEVEFWNNPLAVVDQRVQAVQAEATNRFLNLAESAARSRYQDFDDKINVFRSLVANYPVLRDQGMQAADPAEFAYRTAENFMRQYQQQNGQPQGQDMDALRAQIRAEVEAENQAKINAEIARRLPGSLTDLPAVGSNSGPKWAGPQSIGKVLGR